MIWSRRFDGRAAADLAAFGLDGAAARRASRSRDRPQEVAEQADILSVHVALAPDTKALVNADVLGRLKPGAMFINTARGRGRRLRRARRRRARARPARRPRRLQERAGQRHRPRTNDPLVQAPGVYGTHHIGASTEQAQEAIAAETVRIVALVQGHRPGAERRQPRAADAGDAPCSSCGTATGRASWRTCSSTCAPANINVQETENIIFEGAEAAVARINLDGAPSDDVVATIEAGNEDIISVQIVRI